ncbi:MAG: T9SS type A sorting domain-containing protein [Candidatus Marinimicrobia bacterium]|jgi:hypothetical protein|nr:T9SS type A sorting domain-containing protein [Candidatus Neomarinimicrobiota bacterium]
MKNLIVLLVGLILLPVLVFAQYTGGSYDGYAMGMSAGELPMTRVIEVQNLDISGNEDSLHIITHNPDISYNFYDSFGEEQTTYHVQVSTYSDFSNIDMWDTGEVLSSDSVITYSGSSLQDGETYYLRIKSSVDGYWSEWNALSFRMNSNPSLPVVISPVNDTIVTTPIILKINESMDSESDELTYSFNVYSDSDLTTKLDSAERITNTSWQITEILPDNVQYWWTASANDGYEESEITSPNSFLVNSANDSPGAFRLLSPSDSAEITSLNPILDWENAFDPDPVDTVQYILYYGKEILDLKSVNVDKDTVYQITDSLADNSIYYWKVSAVDNESITETEVWKFWTNTELEPPEPFALLLPSNNQEGLSTTPNFKWNQASDNDPNDYAVYNLVIAKDEEFNQIQLTVTGITDTTYIPSIDLDNNNIYYWKVKAVDTDSLMTASEVNAFTVGTVSVKDKNTSIPNEYALNQNYPNPFNPTTTISYDLPNSSFVTISVYDITGNLVENLINENKEAGSYSVKWNASNISSGIYLYRLVTNDFVSTKKLVLLK